EANLPAADTDRRAVFPGAGARVALHAGKLRGGGRRRGRIRGQCLAVRAYLTQPFSRTTPYAAASGWERPFRVVQDGQQTTSACVTRGQGYGRTAYSRAGVGGQGLARRDRQGRRGSCVDSQRQRR